MSLLIAAAAMQLATAESDGWTAGQVYGGVMIILFLGSLFFWFLGVHADRSFFLVLGSLCCAGGNVLFANFVTDQGGSSTVATVYVCLAMGNLYALYCQFVKYRRQGVLDSDEDEDGEQEEDGQGQHADDTAHLTSDHQSGSQLVQRK